MLNAGAGRRGASSGHPTRTQEHTHLSLRLPSLPGRPLRLCARLRRRRRVLVADCGAQRGIQVVLAAVPRERETKAKARWGASLCQVVDWREMSVRGRAMLMRQAWGHS